MAAASLLMSASFAGSAGAAPITYLVDRTFTDDSGPNAGATLGITGWIQTDGTLGTLSESNIVSWLLNFQTSATTYVSNSATSGVVSLSGDAVSATMSGLIFTPTSTSTDPSALRFYTASGGNYWCLNRNLGSTCYGTYLESFAFTGVVDEWAENTSERDPFVFAGVGASVPVPAALPLLASGLGALGFFGWRRKRSTGV